MFECAAFSIIYADKLIYIYIQAHVPVCFLRLSKGHLLCVAEVFKSELMAYGKADDGSLVNLTMMEFQKHFVRTQRCQCLSFITCPFAQIAGGGVKIYS